MKNGTNYVPSTCPVYKLSDFNLVGCLMTKIYEKKLTDAMIRPNRGDNNIVELPDMYAIPINQVDTAQVTELESKVFDEAKELTSK